LSEIYDVTLNYCLKTRGVLFNSEDDSSVIAQMTPELYIKLKAEKVIHSGMIPQIDTVPIAIQRSQQTNQN
jgi:acetylglutamate kinase